MKIEIIKPISYLNRIDINKSILANALKLNLSYSTIQKYLKVWLDFNLITLKKHDKREKHIMITSKGNKVIQTLIVLENMVYLTDKKAKVNPKLKTKTKPKTKVKSKTKSK